MEIHHTNNLLIKLISKVIIKDNIIYDLEEKFYFSKKELDLVKIKISYIAQKSIIIKYSLFSNAKSR